MEVPIVVDIDGIKTYLEQNDIVDVVMCEECEWWNGETHGCIRNPSVEPWWETDYCSYGERRRP